MWCIVQKNIKQTLKRMILCGHIYCAEICCYIKQQDTKHLLLLFSHPVMSDSLWPHELQQARSSRPSPSPEVCPSSCSLHQWCHPTISSWCPPLLMTSIFPSIRDFSHESTVCIRWPEYWSFSFNISPSSEYSGSISLQIDWFGLLDVQGNLKMFKGINSSVVRFLYGPTLTTVHDHWEEHSLNYMDLPLSAE